MESIKTLKEKVTELKQLVTNNDDITYGSYSEILFIIEQLESAINTIELEE